MKLSLRPIVRLLAVAASATLAVGTTVLEAQAATFSEKELDQSKFVLVAAPIGSGNIHQLLILEQISSEKQCWSESGSNPVIVDPLLLNFDFTGLCGRSVDQNGYSIRVDGEDLGGRYLVQIRKTDTDMVLMGIPDSKAGGDQEIELGRTNGKTTGFAKISLDPDWRLTKRSFKKKTLGHVYLSKGISAVPFPDVENDIYLKDISQAVALKFIAGFEDNTFRPLESLTREQLVSMILESLKNIPGVNFTVPSQTSGNPYPDVAASRWSAAKIAFAQQNDIVKGYPDGTFQPTRKVTRAEMMAVLKKAAIYAKSLGGLDTQLAAKQPPTNFTDTSGHWAAPVITEMSSYCGVASPLNEKGFAFTPNQSAQRNYAAAATLRTLNCVKADASAAPTAAPTTPTNTAPTVPTPSAPAPDVSKPSVPAPAVPTPDTTVPTP
ncbi:DUF3747 domain-containing protein [Acaryochloris sp. IP29b_bin.137]|uniref:DUF3747 domain-containing protein n=1 Tax=Acaryochloris sp. IP29b_bin.137 TaxID=2969217 RepID=UPI0026085B6A|nr:DUF3747 domain-containing protein [Acaryochloris sp. IP29b_bin.137]